MDKAKRGKIIGLIIIILIALILAMLMVLWIPKTGIDSSNLLVALIGFSGSIIGGSITLIGVRMTIKDQQRREFLNSFSLRYREGKYVQEKFLEGFNNLRGCMDASHYQPIAECLNPLIMNKHDLLYKAAAVSAEAQEEADQYIGKAQEWYKYTLFTKGESDYPTERKEQYYEYFSQMEKHLDSFNSKFELFIKHYHDVR
ncbi:LPXTG cell wall anchor domain-containing protein [Brevibacillus halotolerans]|uniref:LPXTG cell wall anchor domain-containing protein n=1 Tax=Brevibacillus halotolerans TaxID=1507437 RepID=UPI0015EFB4BD|nr:LPXTG cell wall anchor domain-containing protein [Brevibacillus halotolerans]MBA4535441.1 LPXTG cell wall anchor domain-containing protein [Brevibacillus halotolerans]